MKHSQFITILALSALTCLAPARAAADNVLALRYKDGRVSHVLLADRPTVRVDGSEVVITHGSGELRASISDISGINVSTEGGVNDLTANSPSLRWVDASTVAVTGASHVMLVAVDGRVLLEARGDTVISLAPYNGNIFIIKADRATFKLLAR